MTTSEVLLPGVLVALDVAGLHDIIALLKQHVLPRPSTDWTELLLLELRSLMKAPHLTTDARRDWCLWAFEMTGFPTKE